VIDGGRSPFARGSSVHQDWCAWLPEEKALIFQNEERRLESLYNMFSVSLNEAIGLRQAKSLSSSLKALCMTAELCTRLTRPLAGLLRSLHDHSKHYGTIPSASPLDPANFLGQKGQRSARLSELLNHVLLSQRVQFLNKVSTLKEMVENLDRDFCSAASDLTDAVSQHPDHLWKEMAEDHFDLNTCLRESFILLKSFLVVLPAAELEVFEGTIRKQCRCQPTRYVVIESRPISHRRTPAFAGK
jgi:hypothetical protein